MPINEQESTLNNELEAITGAYEGLQNCDDNAITNNVTEAPSEYVMSFENTLATQDERFLNHPGDQSTSSYLMQTMAPQDNTQLHEEVRAVVQPSSKSLLPQR